MSSATYDMTSPMDGPRLFALSTCHRTRSIPGTAGRAVNGELVSKQSSRTSGTIWRLRPGSSMAMASMDGEKQAGK